MLRQINRFHGHGSLRYVYKKGMIIRGRQISIKYTKNEKRKSSRLSVVVSKKVLKSAVGRNRIRRRIYEVLREQLPNFNNSYDCVVMVFSSEVLSLPHPELKKILLEQLSSAQIIK